VVSQFTLSIVLLIGTTIVYRQLRFISHTELGFNKDNVVCVPIKENVGNRYDTFKSELLKDSNILSVSAQYYLFAEEGAFRNTNYDWEGREENQQVDMILNLVDYDFVQLLELELVEGRNFDKKYSTDISGAYILNEQAVKKMGIQSPVGKPFSYGDRKGTIIGIMKDTYFRSLHVKIEPHVFFMLEDVASATQYGVVLIKINGAATREALAKIGRAWAAVNPISPFEFAFLDQKYDNLYRKEKKVGTILNTFTVLALFISCLGLFGMASYLTEQRTKEIGIRKVLGARESGIVALLSKQFTKGVLIANIFAWPSAYFVMGKWLQSFAYRIEIGVLIFLFSGILALGIALLTVGYQVLRASRANPSDSLRYE
jgi:ABC-type antimicrobial peptide transport system permease subunit